MEETVPPSPATAAAGALRSLRQSNRARVVDVLRRHGMASRAEIARLTGLSRSTVSSLVADLQESGLVVEDRASQREAATAQGGRPPVLLGLDPSAGAALGLDFGHRHVRVAIADLSSRVLAERHEAVDVDNSAEESLDVAEQLVEDVLDAAGLDRSRLVAAGVGLPGPIETLRGTVGSSSILPGWVGVDAHAAISERLGLEVTVDNDANLGALGEATFGSGRGARDLVYVKVATGLGAGIILGGRLHRGVRGMAGELGHVQARPDGPLCRCSSRGCLETVAAAPALLELLAATHGEDLTTRDLIRFSRDGDPAARRLLTDSGRAIGKALADISNFLNPELVVVGGDLSAAGDPLLDGIRESLDRFALPLVAEAVQVTAGVLGERAEVLGALALVIGDTDRLSSVGLTAI